MDKESKLRANIQNDFWYSFQNSPQINSIHPQIEGITLKLNFNYDESLKEEFIKLYKPSDKVFFRIECINKDCIYGGFNLSTEINHLISSKKTKFKGHQTCNGYQDYERYLAKNYHCLCRLNYIIEIKYDEKK